MERIARLGIAALACVLLGRGVALAQTGSIAGVARDTSGAVLPGVTVEAASPVLIEKVRSVITDGQGVYKIIDLRPGHLHRHVHAVGLQRAQARGDRADVGFHGDRQRRPARRRGRGNGDGDRREPAHRHAERDAEKIADPRPHRRAADRPQLPEPQRAGAGRADRARVAGRRRHGRRPLSDAVGARQPRRIRCRWS